MDGGRIRILDGPTRAKACHGQCFHNIVGGRRRRRIFRDSWVWLLCRLLLLHQFVDAIDQKTDQMFLFGFVVVVAVAGLFFFGDVLQGRITDEKPQGRWDGVAVVFVVVVAVVKLLGAVSVVQEYAVGEAARTRGGWTVVPLMGATVLHTYRGKHNFKAGRGVVRVAFSRCHRGF